MEQTSGVLKSFFVRCSPALVLTLLLTNLTACALFAERPGPARAAGAREQVYQASYEEVWRAVNLVLQPYPLRVSNMDQGILETDTLRGHRLWTPPYKREGAATSGESYRLSVRVIKGAQGSRSAIKVTVLKDTQLQIDFFSDPRAVLSDGLEEKAILYRVGREIQVERALARAQRKANKQQ